MYLRAMDHSEGNREGWGFGGPSNSGWNARYLVYTVKEAAGQGSVGAMTMFIRANSAEPNWNAVTTVLNPGGTALDTSTATTFVVDITKLNGYDLYIGDVDLSSAPGHVMFQIGFVTNSSDGGYVFQDSLAGAWLTDMALGVGGYAAVGTGGLAWYTKDEIFVPEPEPETPDLFLRGVPGPLADESGAGNNPNFTGGSGSATNGNRWHSSVDGTYMGGSGTIVEFIAGNAWIRYPSTDIRGGIAKFEAEIAANGAGARSVQVLVADPGQPIGQATPIGAIASSAGTGGWQSYETWPYAGEIGAHDDGVKDIYVRLVGGNLNYGGLKLYLNPAPPVFAFANFNASWLANGGISPGSYGGVDGVMALNNGGGFWGSIGNAGAGLATGNSTEYEVDLYFNAARSPGSEGAYWGFVGPQPVRETYDSAGRLGVAAPAVDARGVNMDYTKQALKEDGSIDDIAWAPIGMADGKFHLSGAYRLHGLPITNSQWDFGILVNNLPTDGRIYIMGFKAVVRRDAAAGGDVALVWGDMAPPAYPDEPTGQDRTLKVVAVGDSITAGDLGYSDASHASYGHSGADSYPSTLGRLLGRGFSVLNKGLPGACIHLGGEMPYWTWDNNAHRLSSGIEYQPDVVLFLMGGNDSHDGNWPRLGSTDAQRETNFKASLRTYLDYYLGLDSRPIVVMGSTIGCLSPTEYTNNNARTQLIVQWEKDVAAEAAYGGRVLFIDEYAWSMADTSVFNPYDHVHLTREGYIARANNIHAFLLDQLAPTLTLTAAPDKLEYSKGEELSLAGAKLRADFDGHIADFEAYAGADGTLHPGVTVSGYDADETGTQAVRLEYWGQAAEFEVTVNGEVAVDGFSIGGVAGAVSDATRTIHITLPGAFGLTSLTPAFELPEGSTASPGGARDFTEPQAYQITAADGTKANYTVTASVFDAGLLGARPIKVYCVGDSITRGAGGSVPYPQQLQNKLDAKYGAGAFTVRNGGRDGYGAQRNTIYPAPEVGSGWYGKAGSWSDVASFQPDIVIFAIGANNAKSGGPEGSWVDEATFRADYRELLDMALELPTHPLVIVGTSLRAKGAGNFYISPGIIEESIVPIQREVAAEYGLGTLDGYALSESILPYGYSDDNIHLNDAGYERLGQWYFDYVSALYDSRIEFVGLAADGAAGFATTAELTLTFSAPIPGLTADNVSVTGGAAKGALRGAGPAYTLAVSGIAAEGAEATVTVSPPAGYAIDPASRTVALHKAAVGVPLFSDGGGSALEGLSSETLVTTLYREAARAEKLTMLVAVYSKDGKLAYLGQDTKAIAAGETAEFQVRLQMPDNADGSFQAKGHYASVMLWDSATLAPAAAMHAFS
jgi:lysophospholipase L1-like esterase